MTATADQPDPDELVQCNIRIPRSLRDGIDARRAQVTTPDGKPISRDKWAARAFAFALRQPQQSPGATPTAPGQRTAPPPHRR